MVLNTLEGDSAGVALVTATVDVLTDTELEVEVTRTLEVLVESELELATCCCELVGDGTTALVLELGCRTVVGDKTTVVVCCASVVIVASDENTVDVLKLGSGSTVLEGATRVVLVVGCTSVGVDGLKLELDVCVLVGEDTMLKASAVDCVGNTLVDDGMNVLSAAIELELNCGGTELLNAGLKMEVLTAVVAASELICIVRALVGVMTRVTSVVRLLEIEDDDSTGTDTVDVSSIASAVLVCDAAETVVILVKDWTTLDETVGKSILVGLIAACTDDEAADCRHAHVELVMSQSVVQTANSRMA